MWALEKHEKALERPYLLDQDLSRHPVILIESNIEGSNLKQGGVDGPCEVCILEASTAGCILKLLHISGHQNPGGEPASDGGREATPCRPFCPSLCPLRPVLFVWAVRKKAQRPTRRRGDEGARRAGTRQGPGPEEEPGEEQATGHCGHTQSACHWWGRAALPHHALTLAPSPIQRLVWGAEVAPFVGALCSSSFFPAFSFDDSRQWAFTVISLVFYDEGKNLRLI